MAALGRQQAWGTAKVDDAEDRSLCSGKDSKHQRVDDSVQLLAAVARDSAVQEVRAVQEPAVEFEADGLGRGSAKLEARFGNGREDPAAEFNPGRSTPTKYEASTFGIHRISTPPAKIHISGTTCSNSGPRNTATSGLAKIITGTNATSEAHMDRRAHFATSADRPS